MGGGLELDGYVDSEKLIKVTKEFELKIDIEKLINE